MGGFFGDIARTVGGAGSDLGTAKLSLQDIQQRLAAQKTQDLLAQLQIKEGTQRVAESQQRMQMQTPEGVRMYLTKVLQRQPTDAEVQTYLGIVPKAPTTTPIDKDALRQQLLTLANDPKATPLERRVYGSLMQNVDEGGDPKEIMGKLQAFQTSRAEEPGPGKDEPVKTEVFGGYRWQLDPAKKISGTRDSTGQYVRLGPVKEGGAGGEVAPSSLDALIYDIAQGKATLPGGKLGAQVAARAKELNVDLPDVRTQSRTEAQKAASDVSAAFRNYQTKQAALSKIGWASPLQKAAAKQAVDAAKMDLQSKAQSAVDAFNKAGVPVPQWLQNYVGTSTPTNIPPPPPGFTLDKPDA